MTSATNELVDSLTTTAGTLPILTDCVVEKSVPVIVTNVPTAPDVGENVTAPADPAPVPIDFWDEPPPQPTVVISIAATTMTSPTTELEFMATLPEKIFQLRVPQQLAKVYQQLAAAIRSLLDEVG